MHVRYAFRRGRPWNSNEDRAVLAAEPGQFRRVAAELGRTHGAVKARRTQLRRQALAAMVPSLEASVWCAAAGE